MGRNDQLVDRLESEDVLHGRDRPALEHVAVRGDPGGTEIRDEPVDAPASRCPPGVPVDDVAGARVVHRRHDDGADRPLLGPAPDGVEELDADERLVRDDENDGRLGLEDHIAHVAASWSAPPRRTACLAPGTPYSYGPPTTCGISSKLNTGGGDVTCHSIVSAF